MPSREASPGCPAWLEGMSVFASPLLCYARYTPTRYGTLRFVRFMWGCVRIEETTFDALLRKAAQQTTRRETVGALVAGALVLATQGESNANKKADRRKRRQRKQQSTCFRPRQPVSLLIDNTSGEMPITIEWGWRNPDRCCGQVRDTIVIAQPGQKLTFNAPT